MPGTDELFVLMVVTQDVADVLTEEALDALAEFLYPLDVFLLHVPGAVGVVRLSGLERLDRLLRSVVEGDVSDQISDVREGPHRFYGDRLG